MRRHPHALLVIASLVCVSACENPDEDAAAAQPALIVASVGPDIDVRGVRPGPASQYSFAAAADSPVEAAAPASAVGPCAASAAEIDCVTDDDGDGVVARFDCDDTDPRVSPLSADIYCDGRDQNCNGFDECDADHDGILSVSDCDDDDTRVGACGEPVAGPPRITL